MRCNVCGSDNAKIYKRASEGRETALTVCPACYRKLYPEAGTGDFFTSFIGHTKEDKESLVTKVCEGCGTTLEDFRKTGIVGCAYCYTAFREQLLPTIRYMQGRLRHEGRAPSGAADEKYDTVRELVHEQEALRGALKKAVDAGDGAQADQLRTRLDAVNRRLYGGEEA